MPSSSLAFRGKKVIHMALPLKNDLTFNTVALPALRATLSRKRAREKTGPRLTFSFLREAGEGRDGGERRLFAWKRHF